MISASLSLIGIALLIRFFDVLFFFFCSKLFSAFSFYFLIRRAVISVRLANKTETGLGTNVVRVHICYAYSHINTRMV